MIALSTFVQVDAPFATALVELGRRRKDVVVLSADLSKYTDVLPFARGVSRTASSRSEWPRRT